MIVLINLCQKLSRRLSKMFVRLLCMVICTLGTGSGAVGASDHFYMLLNMVSKMGTLIAPKIDVLRTDDESYPDVIVDTDEPLNQSLSTLKNEFTEFERQKNNFTEYMKKFKHDYKIVPPNGRMDHDIISRLWYVFYKVNPDPSHLDWNINQLLPYLIEGGQPPFLTDNGLLKEPPLKDNKFESTSVLCVKLEAYFNKLLLQDKTQEEQIACFGILLEEIFLWNQKYESFWGQNVDRRSGEAQSTLKCEYFGKNPNILFPDSFFIVRKINPSELFKMSPQQIEEKILDELKVCDFSELLATYAESEGN